MSPYCGSAYSYWNPPKVWNAFLPPVWQRTQIHIPNHPKFCMSPSSSLEVSHSLSSRSSGKVERANRVLKETLTKWTIKFHRDWTKRLPLAFFKVWALQKKTLTYQSVWDHVCEAHNTFGPPLLPRQSQTAFPPPFSFTCPDTKCPLQHIGNLLPWPHPNLPHPSL